MTRDSKRPTNYPYGCDRAIPNPNLLIKSFARKIKHLLKNIVVLYSPGSYANALDVGL
jgi:hypothetical protein